MMDTDVINNAIPSVYIGQDTKSSDKISSTDLASIASSDEESEIHTRKFKKRVQRFSDSDIDEPKEHESAGNNETDIKENQVSRIHFSCVNRSRIKMLSDSDESNFETEEFQVAIKNDEQQQRMKNKKKKLKDKFKNFINSREKDLDEQNKHVDQISIRETSENEQSESSNDEISSIDVMKQKLKERTNNLKLSICDPETSDEEITVSKKVCNSKIVHKRTKSTPPKPQRMSAKEAMENMQKIKSESNRMLREKEVSLPYHRPKALSLQDIMSRRRPAVSSDGKALPIKMNGEQLKQYALLLEQRQKEMMELYKSESEEEEIIEKEEDINKDSKNIDTSKQKEKDIGEIKEDQNAMTTQNEDYLRKEIIKTDDDTRKPVDTNTGPETLETTEDNVSLKDDFQNKSEELSAEMLLYNDSVEETSATDALNKNENNKGFHPISKQVPGVDSNLKVKNAETESSEIFKGDKSNKLLNEHSEQESQLLTLHYDSEKTEPDVCNTFTKVKVNICSDNKNLDTPDNTEFPDDEIDMNDIDMNDIDNIIENAEILDGNTTNMNSPALIKDLPILSIKPKLTGAPGMVIDLDGSDPVAPKKLTGVELLKERFSFFAKLKTPEEMEREREKRQKPGAQHLKLKQQLEDKIAEQRSLEWSKRLEGEKQQQIESARICGNESDDEDDIDKIEAKLNENDEIKESSSESEEEDLPENDVIIEDKPIKNNLLIDNEAEESDVDDKENDSDKVNDDEETYDDDQQQSGNDSTSSDESSESEEENEKKPKKGRILKAFEDSDDEDTTILNQKDDICDESDLIIKDNLTSINKISQILSDDVTESQDVVIQLGQVPKQLSGDIFISQSSTNTIMSAKKNDDEDVMEENLGTQTFSILNSSTVNGLNVDDPDKLTVMLDDKEKDSTKTELDKLVMCNTQPLTQDNLDNIAALCSGNFETQNCVPIEVPTESQQSQSQAIGEDLLNMCTGKFYDNEFVSLNEDNNDLNSSKDMTLSPSLEPSKSDSIENDCDMKLIEIRDKHKENQEDILKSVLDELNEPEFETSKPLKFFYDEKTQNNENQQNITNIQTKKRLVIDSDDDINNDVKATNTKKKKLKKRKLEKRALQISDDEDEISDHDNEDDFASDNVNDDEERLVEYDSEENEVEVGPEVVKKKKRKTTEFFEQEAELTSEDEWIGSGDEDEAGLDRMEREDGDDDTFHQGKLQRELGQIHMRDVLDQDKREVRLIQELLFEDGDLGDGGRQRKFRWRNADGEEMAGTIPDQFGDTQDEEFESEEQWRKQRHEREMFLRQLKSDKKEDELNVSVSRTSIIKANLSSRTMSSLLEEVNHTTVVVKGAVPEKKSAKDIPSPVKKPFSIFQQQYQGSLLTRGQGALARLAALASPLAADDDAPALGLLAPTTKRNFVFAAVTPDDEEPKVTKRKAESNIGTPKLVKKMKTEEKKNISKNSLLDHIHV